jgi:pre-mRNA-splicing factor 18
MSALSVLHAEIEKKKQAAKLLQEKLAAGRDGSGLAESQSAGSATAPAVTAPAHKYMRRGDVDAILAGQKRARDEIQKEADDKKDLESGKTTLPVPKTISAPSAGPSVPEAFLSLEAIEVQRRLRRYGQVVTYFGEDNIARVARLWEYVNSHLAEKEEMGVKGGFDDSAHLKKLKGDVSADTAAWMVQKLAGGAEDASGDGLGDAAAAKRRRTDAGILGTADAAAAAAAGEDSDERSTGKSKARVVAADAAQYKDKDDYKYIYKYFKGLLNEWEDELARRSDAERHSATGKQDMYFQKQSKEFLRPLFRMCKHKTLPGDVKRFCKEIASCCEAREYAKAGDAYIRLAIGNAAWPIGVTAVGLHERAAREKVAEGKQAHVMHDEETRKYVTILKRMISFAQSIYPTDPSKMMYS